LVEARKRSITKSEFCHFVLVLIWQQTQSKRSYHYAFDHWPFNNLERCWVLTTFLLIDWILLIVGAKRKKWVDWLTWHACTFAGIDNNETIKVYRSGGADPDGDNPGDLYVTIKVTVQSSHCLVIIYIFLSYIFPQARSFIYHVPLCRSGKILSSVEKDLIFM